MKASLLLVALLAVGCHDNVPPGGGIVTTSDADGGSSTTTSSTAVPKAIKNGELQNLTTNKPICQWRAQTGSHFRKRVRQRSAIGS